MTPFDIMNSDDDEVEFVGTTNNVNNRPAKTNVINNSNDIIGLAEYRAEASLKYHQRKQKSNNDNRTNKDNVIDVDTIDFSSRKGLSGSLPPGRCASRDVHLKIISDDMVLTLQERF